MVNESAVLTVRNLQIVYEGNPIISDLSFTVEKRDILIILGPNGADKTTLLRALQNLLPYQRGWFHGVIRKSVTFLCKSS